MRAHADIEGHRPFRLMEALNFHLRPDPIAVLDCRIVADDWHARFSCIGRSYIYRIANRRAPLTLDANRAWQVQKPLDAEAMHEAAQALVGRHDFTTFRSVHCQAQSPLKTLDSLNVRREGDRVIIDTAARSYLHHQVRSMVGCLSLVGWAAGRSRRWPRLWKRGSQGAGAECAFGWAVFRSGVLSGKDEGRCEGSPSRSITSPDDKAVAPKPSAQPLHQHNEKAPQAESPGALTIIWN
jgi:tRNA pseudouridine(38-40) synthase